MDPVSIIGLVVGVVSFSASIVFFVLGSKSERRNQELLNSINEAIQKWQSRIMESSIELLNSRPEIIAKNVALEESRAKQEFLAQISERIRFMIENPAAGDGAPAQSHTLTQLLQAFEALTKGPLPPEILAQMVMSEHRSSGGGA